MDFDALLLSRLQFAFTIAFHIIFPSFTIGLASYLAVLEGLWLKTGDDAYYALYRFWLKIFAVSFGLGVVSGVVMSYQFGTNWSRFSELAGNIVGPLLGYEVLTAFFLEASFLGIMLFGLNRVGPGLHFLSTCIVAGGTLISAFWILAANSWMQAPAGYEIRDGIFYPTDWLAIVFSPTFPYRLVHMVLAAYITTAFAVVGVGAWQLLKGRRDRPVRLMAAMGLGLLAILTPLQLVAGHEHGVSVYREQPSKLAAIEGHWESYEGRAPLILFGWPSQTEERNLHEVAIPEIGSLVVTGSLDGAIRGLKSWPAEDRPPVAITFWAFRIMVGIGLVMIAVSLLGAWYAYSGRLEKQAWFQRILVLMLPSGFVAVLSGWVTAEVGRQPWTVFGQLRTADSVSPVPGASVAVSLLVFMIVYAIVFTAGVLFMGRLAAKGPETGAAPPKRPDREDVPAYLAPNSAATATGEGD